MKLSAIILLAACMQLHAKGYAQLISLSEKNVPLEKVFRSIEKQTGFVFFYDHKLIDNTSKITIDLRNVTLEKALDMCLKDQSLTWSIVNRNIVIKPRAPEVLSQLPTPQDTLLNITGRVLSDNGQPLPGATIKVKGSSNGVVTDADGNFKIKVSRHATIIASYMGYKSQEVEITGPQTQLFNLVAAATLTDEIVVIGYGTVKKSDLTGSLSQVKAKDITSFPTTNVMQSLNGRAAGVRVTQNNGAPGASVSLRIRGTNSILGGNEPLYVIDGFPYNGNPTFLQNADIATIEVLKDASSTAIYGSRGANGVVMITTKSGKKMEITSVDVEAGYTLQSVSKKMKLMNAQQYALLYNEQAANDGLTPYFNQAQIDSLGQHAGTDWQDLVLRKAPLYNMSASVNGGNSKTRFSLSSAAYLQEGIIRGSDYKRYNVRGNIEHDISKAVSVSLNTILTRLNSSRKNSSMGNRGNDLISGMLMAPPSLSPYMPDGSYRRLNTAYSFISNVIVNPLVHIYEESDLIKGDRVFSNAALTIKPIKGLTIRISGGIDNLNDRVDQYNNIEPTVNSVGFANIETTQQTGLLNENVVSYQHDFNKHSLNIMGGFTYQDNTNTTLNAAGSGFLSDVPGSGDIESAFTPGIPNSSYSKWVLLSYLSRFNYSYNDKYLLTFSIRRDGSSRYSKQNQWANFPSAAIAWKAGNEAFLKNSTVVSDMKVRASYGLSGNTSINPYQTLNQLIAGNTIFGDASFVAYAPGTTLPGDLKWETTRQLDIGADVGFLHNNLSVTLDYYQKKTVNLLNTVRLPASMGYTTTLKNVGEIENKGFELGIDATILKGSVNWNVNANMAINRNKVVKLYNGQDIYGDAVYTGSLNDYINILREGQPLGIFYGYKENGYTSTGNLQYLDLNKDGAITADDKTYIGNPNPDFIYGFNSVLGWKGFELTVFIQGSKGNDIFNLNKAAALDLGMGLNLPREVYESHWTSENTTAKYPKISRTLSANMSDRFVEDGSYMRFKNIQLAYSIPTKKLGWQWLKSAQVYASGQNLITITKYSWYDPEVNAYGGSNSIRQGIDYSVYPTFKSVTFGIRCGF